MENTKLNIYQKLRKVQTELKAPKGQYNSFGKYAYRSCEDILEALKPILDKEQLVLVIEDDIEEIQEIQKGLGVIATGLLIASLLSLLVVGIIPVAYLCVGIVTTVKRRRS